MNAFSACFLLLSLSCGIKRMSKSSMTVQLRERMSAYLLAGLVFLLTTPSFAADVPETENDRTLYAIGLLVSRSLTVFNLTPDELEIVKQGITDAATGKHPAVDLEVYNPKVQELARARRKDQGERMASANKAFEEKAASEKGAVKT